MELDLTHFEPLLNEAPFRVLSRHPNGLLVALQVVTSHPQAGGTAAFSALWDVQTRKLVEAADDRRAGTRGWQRTRSDP